MIRCCLQLSFTRLALINITTQTRNCTMNRNHLGTGEIDTGCHRPQMFPSKGLVEYFFLNLENNFTKDWEKNNRTGKWKLQEAVGWKREGVFGVTHPTPVQETVRKAFMSEKTRVCTWGFALVASSAFGLSSGCDTNHSLWKCHYVICGAPTSRPQQGPWVQCAHEWYEPKLHRGLWANSRKRAVIVTICKMQVITELISTCKRRCRCWVQHHQPH